MCVSLTIQFHENLRFSKVKRYLPELESPDSQHAIKIVSIIFPVIHHKCRLRATDSFPIKFRNPHLRALKCSSCVGDQFLSPVQANRWEPTLDFGTE